MTAAVLAGLCLAAVLITALYSRRRIQEIHVLVNRRLEVALTENKELKAAAAQRPESRSAPSEADRIDDG